MKCPNCKSEIPADSKFCPDCGTEIKKNSSDIISTFLSLGGITLGKSNIYDVESSEYIKANESEFGDYKVIKAKTEDGIECVANAKDKMVFAFIIRDVSSIELPESWKKLKIDEDNLSLSMERVLGKNGFEWEDFENGGTSRGFAFKKANEEKYLTFVIEKDDALAIAMLDDEQKSSLYANLQADNDIDDELEEEVEEEELPCCPNCGSYDVDDDYSDYLQYTCNKCGHNWGHDDTVECPECGSNDVENDGTDYQQYTCNDCGHVWGDDEKENEDIMAKFFPVLDITLGKTSDNDIRNKKHLFAEVEYCDSGLVIAWSKDKNGYKGAQIRQEPNDYCFTNIYITCGDEMFEKWKSLGFCWALSYDRWISLFEKLGFEIKISKYPKTEYNKDWNRCYLSASFLATSDDGYLIFELHFDYGNIHDEGCSTSSRNSLYSISVKTSDSTYSY